MYASATVPTPMSYTVLARKYRPQTFADLVGQEHVTRTLSNAIESDRVAHAFLFTGVRGVGKTTSARLVAKALNCLTNGPSPTPCNTCDACKEITSGVDLDVLEMDGASNNSVEDVRRLQESIPYRPSRDRYKIVIVDEVHMLSTGAFNAFLKTLEEPPSHAKFIFATTESHKVPITIRSRCQRYDFRLIPQTVIGERVRQILSMEEISADDETIAIVAREAAGSMRDALTLLDQIVAFGGTNLHGKEVAALLGIAERETVHAVAGAVLNGKAAETLKAVHDLATRGLDMLHFAKQLLGYFRQLVVLQVAGADADELLSLGQEEKAVAQALASSTESLELQRAFSALSLLVEDVARASSPQTVLEMGLVRLATRPPLQAVSEVLARLEALEHRFRSGASSGTPPSAAGRGPRPGGSPPPSSGGQTAGAASKPSPPVPSAAPAAPTGPPVPSAPPSPATAPPATTQAPAAQTAERATPTQDPTTPPEDPSAPPEGMVSSWQRIVLRLRDTRPALAAVLEHGAPLRVDRECVTVGFPPGSFFGQQAATEESKDGLATEASHVVGARPKIVVKFTADAELPAPTVAGIEEKRRDGVREERRKAAMEHPTVQAAREVFPEAAGGMRVLVDSE